MFVKDDFIVCLIDGEITEKNFIFCQMTTSRYLTPYIDINRRCGNTELKIEFKDTKSWRYATREERLEYLQNIAIAKKNCSSGKLKGPYNVLTLIEVELATPKEEC